MRLSTSVAALYVTSDASRPHIVANDSDAIASHIKTAIVTCLIRLPFQWQRLGGVIVQWVWPGFRSA